MAAGNDVHAKLMDEADLKARCKISLAAGLLLIVWGCGGKLLVDKNGAAAGEPGVGATASVGSVAGTGSSSSGAESAQGGAGNRSSTGAAGGGNAGVLVDDGGTFSDAGASASVSVGGQMLQSSGAGGTEGGALGQAGAGGTNEVAGAGTAGNAGETGDTCKDFHQDGDETDADCGGNCAPCEVGKGCSQNSDCASLACDAISLLCVADQCGDHHTDETESDVDCGGSNGCARCHVGKKCRLNYDCQAGHQCSTVEPLVCL
jgi:hypothetical protein